MKSRQSPALHSQHPHRESPRRRYANRHPHERIATHQASRLSRPRSRPRLDRRGILQVAHRNQIARCRIRRQLHEPRLSLSQPADKARRCREARRYASAHRTNREVGDLRPNRRRNPQGRQSRSPRRSLGRRSRHHEGRNLHRQRRHVESRQTGHDQAHYAWRLWTYDWKAAKTGDYTILSRATDSQGRTQPSTPAWNPSGYLYNAVRSGENPCLLTCLGIRLKACSDRGRAALKRRFKRLVKRLG